ncbi:hypothetical protein [Sporanaerobium hydrogeniformans]|uniref:hypothetical protein n=1 Tax=Sporanaerobium hydrogeniformans TaxID=3072179 RepID=UPI0015D5191A|nr:hypothetical protein [Sporanaerobium hydrogeniformans]
MKTLLNKKDVNELDVLKTVLEEFTAEEQKDLLLFMQGIRFAKKLEEKTPA